MTEIKELLPYLTNMKNGGFLIVRNIEAVSRTVLGFLENAMKRFSVDICLGERENMRCIGFKLQPFTLVSISQSIDGVSEMIRDHSIPIFFSNYTHEESLQILCQRALHSGLDLRIGQIIDAKILREILFSVNGSAHKAIAILTKALTLNPEQITYETLELIGHAIPKNTLITGEQREHQLRR